MFLYLLFVYFLCICLCVVCVCIYVYKYACILCAHAFGGQRSGVSITFHHLFLDRFCHFACKSLQDKTNWPVNCPGDMSPRAYTKVCRQTSHVHKIKFNNFKKQNQTFLHEVQTKKMAWWTDRFRCLKNITQVCVLTSTCMYQHIHIHTKCLICD